MIFKNTSVQRVIAKIFTDFQLNEGDHRISDLIEYAGEALEKIGAFPYFEYKVTGRDGEPSLPFVNYQSKLPNNLHRVIGVAYSSTETGTLYPMRYSTGIMGNTNVVTSTQLNDSFTTASTGDAVVLAMQLYDLTYELALTKINDEPATKALLNALLSNSSKSSVNNANNTTDLTYIISNGFIKTNVDSGYLTIAYQAMPCDIDGYPLVPDDPGFIEAVYWYIAMKLLYPQWRDGRVRDAVYFDAKSSWQFYCKQAYGNAMMPSVDQLRSIKNSWLRLIPDINEGDNFFTSLGQQENVYNHNR
jgi:hypothetical protein